MKTLLPNPLTVTLPKQYDAALLLEFIDFQVQCRALSSKLSGPIDYIAPALIERIRQNRTDSPLQLVKANKSLPILARHFNALHRIWMFIEII